MNILKYSSISINKQKEEFINESPPFKTKTLFKSFILVIKSENLRNIKQLK